MKLLHIDSSIQGRNSVTRAISAAIVGHLRQSNPDVIVTYRDLAKGELSHLKDGHLVAVTPDTTVDSSLREDISLGQTVLEEFLNADIVVIGAPMYNFTIPSQLKAWVDRIIVPGKTFSYGPQGAEGLAGNKRIFVAVSRGGSYDASTHAAGEYVETYLRWVFGFIGVKTPVFIAADGVRMGPQQHEIALANALKSVSNLAA